MLGPVRILLTVSAAIMPAILELRDRVFRGLCYTARAFRPVVKLQIRNIIIKRDGAAMNLTG